MKIALQEPPLRRIDQGSLGISIHCRCSSTSGTKKTRIIHKREPIPQENSEIAQSLQLSNSHRDFPPSPHHVSSPTLPHQPLLHPTHPSQKPKNLQHRPQNRASQARRPHIRHGKDDSRMHQIIRDAAVGALPVPRKSIKDTVYNPFSNPSLARHSLISISTSSSPRLKKKKAPPPAPP